MAQWFAPKPFKLIVHSMDFRQGGKFSMAMRGPDGNDFPFTGMYGLIAPPALLSWGGAFTGPDEQMATTVSFEEEDGKTRLRARQTFFVMTPMIVEATKGANQGWNMTLDQLGEFVKRVVTPWVRGSHPRGAASASPRGWRVLDCQDVLKVS